VASVSWHDALVDFHSIQWQLDVKSRTLGGSVKRHCAKVLCYNPLDSIESQPQSSTEWLGSRLICQPQAKLIPHIVFNELRMLAQRERRTRTALSGLFNSCARFPASLLRAEILPICSSALVYSLFRSIRTRIIRSVIDRIPVNNAGNWLSWSSSSQTLPEARPSAFQA
jgi:hypothetical protein